MGSGRGEGKIDGRIGIRGVEYDGTCPDQTSGRFHRMFGRNVNFNDELS